MARQQRRMEVVGPERRDLANPLAEVLAEVDDRQQVGSSLADPGERRLVVDVRLPRGSRRATPRR